LIHRFLGQGVLLQEATAKGALRLIIQANEMTENGPEVLRPGNLAFPDLPGRFVVTENFFDQAGQLCLLLCLMTLQIHLDLHPCVCHGQDIFIVTDPHIRPGFNAFERLDGLARRLAVGGRHDKKRDQKRYKDDLFHGSS